MNKNTMENSPNREAVKAVVKARSDEFHALFDKANEHLRSVMERWLDKAGFADRVRVTEVRHADVVWLCVRTADGSMKRVLEVFYRVPWGCRFESRRNGEAFPRSFEVEGYTPRINGKDATAMTEAILIGRIAEDFKTIEESFADFDWASLDAADRALHRARQVLDRLNREEREVEVRRRAEAADASLAAGLRVNLGKLDPYSSRETVATIERVTPKSVFANDGIRTRRFPRGEAAANIARGQWRIVAE